MKFTIPGEPTGKLKRWGDEEIQYLREHYEYMLHKEMAAALNRTPNAVRNKCHELKIIKQVEPWSDDEVQSLKEFYTKAGKTAPINLKNLEQVFGRDKTNICRKAKELGLPTCQNRKQTEETIKAQSEIAKKRIQENGHPKGMLGKQHSQEFKKAASERVANEWKDPNSAFNSEEFRQKKSDYMAAAVASNPLLRRGYSRGRQGKRKDVDNIYFRSSWEANYARYLNWLKLNGGIFKWEYEPDTFWFNEIKRGTRSYLPDFKIWETETSEPYYVEVKGWMDEKSETKLKRMSKYYPHIKVNIVAKPEYREIEKAVSSLIDGWEF